jgi:hypothetical protein
MNPPNPSPLTRAGDAALNEARAALNGLTADQKAEVVATLMIRYRLFAPGALATEAMIVKALPAGER